MIRSSRRDHGETTAHIGVVLSLCVGSFVFQQSLLVPVLPTIQSEMDVGASTANWVFTAYLLSASVLTPLIGRLGDDLGLQRTLLLSMVVMTIGSVMAAFAPSIGWLIAARAVQGAGGAAVPLSFALVRAHYSSRRVGVTIARLASLTSVAFGIGIIVAGPIVSGLGYPALYWIPVLLCATAAMAVWRMLPSSGVPRRPTLPLAAAVWLSLGLSLVLLVISEGQRWGWTSPRSLGALGVSAIGFYCWISAEARARVPLIDLSLVTRRGVWSTSLIALSIGFGNLAAWAFMSQFVQVSPETGFGLGIPEVHAGLILVPMAMAAFVGGLLSSPCQRLVGPRGTVILGCGLAAVANAFLAMVHSAPWHVLFATSVSGLGTGLVFSTMTVVVIVSVPPDQTGVASGLNYNVRSMSGALGATVLGALLGSHGPGSAPSELAFQSGFWVLCCVLSFGALAALLLPKNRAGQSNVDETSLATASNH